MPVYTYKNLETGEIEDLTMSISEMEKFEALKTHERVYDRMHIVDPVGAGITKPPADFSKYVLGRIKAATPHNSIGDGRWSVKREI